MAKSLMSRAWDRIKVGDPFEVIFLEIVAIGIIMFIMIGYILWGQK